jgi:hypothetical protein
LRGDDFDDDGPFDTVDRLMGELSPESNDEDVTNDEGYDDGFD